MTAPRPRMVILLAEGQNWRCCYCGIVMTLPGRHHDSVSLEHLVPRVHGGDGTFENCVAACHKCNHGRDCTDPYQYYELVRLVGRERAPKIVRKHPSFARNQHGGQAAQPRRAKGRPAMPAGEVRAQRRLVGHDVRPGDFVRSDVGEILHARDRNAFEASLEAALRHRNGDPP